MLSAKHKHVLWKLSITFASRRVGEVAFKRARFERDRALFCQNRRLNTPKVQLINCAFAKQSAVTCCASFALASLRYLDLASLRQMRWNELRRNEMICAFARA